MDITRLTKEEREQLKAQLDAEERAEKARVEAEREAYKQMVDATVRGCVQRLQTLSSEMMRVKQEVFAEFDAVKRFAPDVEPTQDPKGCRCGDVLRGVMAPNECPLFRAVCTPENPVGPCMVSSEGSCAAYFRFRD